MTGERWLRNAGTITGASVPKGYKSELARLLEALAHDGEWELWWSGSGFGYLYLYCAFVDPDSRRWAGVGATRFVRKGEYVQATFRSDFEHFDQQRWSVEQAREEARQRLMRFFALAGQRLKIGPPPRLPA